MLVDVWYWHKADVPRWHRDVRFWGKSGRRVLREHALDTGFLDDREDEHDGREPSEDELHFYDRDNKVSIHAANVQAREALLALLQRLRRKAPGEVKTRQASN